MMRTRPILAGGAIMLAAGTLAIAAFSLLQAPPPVAAPSVAQATAEIIRGTLRATKTVTGTLSYGQLSTMRPSLDDASAMVTWIAPVGATVERGQPLYALEGQPTILFYGTVPQHRTLRFDPESAAPVWVELEQAQSAVEAAELTLGLERERLADAEARISDNAARLADALSPTPTTPESALLAGNITAAEARLARVKKLSAAELTPSVEIAAAEAQLAAARAALEATSRGLHKELAAARIDAATARVSVATAEDKLDELHMTLEGLAAQASDDADVQQIADNLAALGYQGPLPAQVRAWLRDSGLPVTGIVGPSQLVVTSGPVHIASHSTSPGETVLASSQDGGAILEFASTEKLVTLPLSVSDQGLAAVGRAVVVTLPDEASVDGTISEIGSIVTDGTIEVTIAIADQAALSDLQVASVDVELVSASRDDVLSVPVAALLARPEGGFAVEVVNGADSTVSPIETGLFASGRVEISGDGLIEGMRVGVPG